MKKLFLIAFTALFALSVNAQSTKPRFGTSASEDNTGRTLTYSSKVSVTLAATDSISPNASMTFYKFTTLAGAKTINAKIKNAHQWDLIILEFTADGTNRVVTFGTNFISAGTDTVVASKKSIVSFVFDGVAWIERSRFIQP
jgi:hypothetical protein